MLFFDRMFALYGNHSIQTVEFNNFEEKTNVKTLDAMCVESFRMECQIKTCLWNMSYQQTIYWPG